MEAGLKTETQGGADGFEVDVTKLTALYQQCLTRPQNFYSNMQQNRDTRYNYWPGRTADGRRWSKNSGDSEVFPWSGASDLPVPMVDGYVNEDVALAVMSIMSGNITASGHSVNDAAYGQRCTNVIKWMLFDEMTERSRETELLANYHFERGMAVLAVLWDRQVQMSYQVLTMEMVAKMAQGAEQQLQQLEMQRMQEMQAQAAQGGSPSPRPSPPGEGGDNRDGAGLEASGEGDEQAPDQITQLQEIAALPLMIADPQYEERLVEMVSQFTEQIVQAEFKKELGAYADELMEDYELKPKTARRVIRELREEGKTKIPIPTVNRNRPTFVSLALNENFFVPSDPTDMENARALFWLEWVTEEQIRERVVSLDWDPDWAEYIIKHGKGSVGANTVPAGTASGSYTGSAQAHGATLLDTAESYGVLHCYEKRSNEDGVPGIYYTVIHPAWPKLTKTEGKVPDYAVTMLLDYAHGEYPFILFRREFLSRRLDDSRGYGEIGATWQRSIKKQLDSQIDRTDLVTIPPLHHPKGRPPTKWGPGVKVPGTKSEYQYADTPHPDAGSELVIQAVQAMADRYFGRATKEGDPVLSQIMRQHLINVWLDGWRLAITQMFQLMQQFLPDEFYYRVVGSDQGQSIHADRSEIQGKFSVSVKFDAQRLDFEAMQTKADAIVKAVNALDINGITDHNKLLATVLGWIDPDVPEQILRPAEQASQQETEDEQTVFARLWAGVGQDVKPGQAYQLRLQVLQDCIEGKDQKTGEPKNPAAVQRYQTDPGFKKLVDDRMQQLKFQLEQRQNAVIGRLGATPANA